MCGACSHQRSGTCRPILLCSDYLKATTLLISAFFILLANSVAANPADIAAGSLSDVDQQLVFVGSPEQLREQAVQIGRSGDYEAAIAILERLLEHDSGNAGALHDLLIILGWNEQDREVLHLADRLEPQTAPVDVLETLAKSSRNVGDFEQSVRWYKLAISNSPARLDGHLGLAMVYADMDRQEEALRTLHSV